MSDIRFFNPHKKMTVSISENYCEKKILTKKRPSLMTPYSVYAIRGVDDDGITLTRFVDKETYNDISCPVWKDISIGNCNN